MAVLKVADMPWEAELTVPALRQWIGAGEVTRAFTQQYYEIRSIDGALVAVAGVAVWSLTRAPEAWILLAKPYFTHLRESLRLTREALHFAAQQYPGLISEVHRENAVELHFASHVGWVPTGRRCLRPDGDNYIQFKVA
jgi:hypothetical protein